MKYICETRETGGGTWDAAGWTWDMSWRTRDTAEGTQHKW